ncbi:MAG: hypothetical protein J6R92_02065 [Akkermansia sp.]|nr:hypothetical protein [Akkermansia sp.]
MKLNVYTTVCAVLTLVLCIILGALFGTATPCVEAVDAACASSMQQAVVGCSKR